MLFGISCIGSPLLPRCALTSAECCEMVPTNEVRLGLILKLVHIMFGCEVFKELPSVALTNHQASVRVGDLLLSEDEEFQVKKEKQINFLFI